MVGAIDLFDAPVHDPDKHLFAIYYVLERLVVNFRWPECPNFCYVLDLKAPPDPPKVDFDVPCEVPYPKHGRMEGLNTLRRGLGVAQMAYPEVRVCISSAFVCLCTTNTQQLKFPPCRGN